MKIELLLALGTSAGFLVFAFLYARARVAAAGAATMAANNKYLKELMVSQAGLLAEKEEYIRDLEKTVLRSLPAGKLAERLTKLFAAGGRREARAVPPVDPAADRT